MINDFQPVEIKGNKLPDPDIRDYIKGINSQIKYVVRMPDGDWTEDYMTYQPQKFRFDTNSCWCISGINCIEDQLDFLIRNGSFPEASIKWFKENGYIDSNNCFRLSWRFIYALSGAYGNGNSQWNFWKLTTKYGLLPQQDFDFSMNDSYQFSTEEDMWKACGDKSKITKAMKDKALKALKYVDIKYEWVGKFPYTPPKKQLQACLLQSPLQIGVPACMSTWNTGVVLSCGRLAADHAIELLKIDEDGTYHIFDQYNPAKKTLSPDYPLLMVVNGVVTPIISYNDIPNVTPFKVNLFSKIWESVKEWFSNYSS